MNNLRALASRALSFIAPRVDRPLWVVLREDRLLRWAMAGLWAAAVIPLFLTPFLPFPDMPNNTAMASLMFDAAFGHGPVAHAFKTSWVPTPYLIGYWTIAFLGPLIGPLAAAKVLVAITLLVVPLGVMRLLVTLRRDPRLALWSFLLSYEHNMFSGWISFVLGVGLCMFVIAWTLEARTVREGLRVALFAALVGIAHVQAVWLLMVTSPLLVFFQGPIKRRFLIHLVAGLGLGITIIPWLVHWLSTKSGGAPAQPFSFEWDSPETKVGQLFAVTLDNFTKRPDVRVDVLAFCVIAIGPLCLSLLPRASTREHTFTPLPLLAAAVGLYAFLFMSIDGPIVHWYTYPRYGLVVLLFWLLVPAPRLDGRWALALLPGILVALALDYQTARAFRKFAGRTEQLLEVMDHVRPQASVLPLIFDDDVLDPELKLPAYHQLTSYISAKRKAVMPSLWGFPGLPVSYREENRTPWPGWDVAAERAFTMDAYGKHYDYVIVQGFERADPVSPLQTGPLPRPHLVVEAGRWRLYEIQR